MSDYTLSDIISAVGGAGGNMFGGNVIWVVLILVFLLIGGGRGWNNGGDYAQVAAQASTQQDILYSSKFQALDNKLDRLGNGLADLGYAIQNSITNEGRGIQMQMAEGFAGTKEAIAQLGNMIQQNEMARVRDDRDYWRGKYGYREETDRILYTQGRYYNNAPCEERDRSCC